MKDNYNIGDIMYKPIQNIKKDLNNRTLSEPVQKIANFLLVHNKGSIAIKTIELFSNKIKLDEVEYPLNKVSYMVRRDKELSKCYSDEFYKPDYINVYLRIKR
jgi:hypothetical protein